MKNQKNTYTIKGRCHNCWQPHKILIKRGTQAVYGWAYPDLVCVRCGCCRLFADDSVIAWPWLPYAIKKD